MLMAWFSVQWRICTSKIGNFSTYSLDKLLHTHVSNDLNYWLGDMNQTNKQTTKNPFLLRLSTTLINYPYYTDGISSRSIYYSESFNYAIKIHVKNWTNNEMTNFGYMWYTCTHTCIWNWLIDKDMYKYSHKRTRRACIAQFKFFNCTK